MLSVTEKFVYQADNHFKTVELKEATLAVDAEAINLCAGLREEQLSWSPRPGQMVDRPEPRRIFVEPPKSSCPQWMQPSRPAETETCTAQDHSGSTFMAASWSGAWNRGPSSRCVLPKPSGRAY